VEELGHFRGVRHFELVLGVLLYLHGEGQGVDFWVWTIVWVLVEGRGFGEEAFQEGREEGAAVVVNVI
jgi:hypothetical protein